MKRSEHAFDPELEVLLERGKVIRRLPDVVRARALARARAAIAAAGYSPAMVPEARSRGRVLRIAVAVSIALAVGAAGATAALLLEKRRAAELDDQSREEVIQEAPVAAAPRRPVAPATTPAPAVKAGPARAAATAVALESYAAELSLLQRIQASYTRRDHAGALALVSEHHRRYPNGRLAEEREAFRVRSLVALGRADEAHRAAAAFARRFPRSVLLPRLQSGLQD